MAENSIKRYYSEADFVGLLPGFAVDETQVGLLGTVLGALALSTPIAEVRRFTLGEAVGAVVEWEGFPSGADITDIDGAVAAFPGGTTTSEPIIATSDAATTTTGAAVVKLTVATPPLDEGTYALNFSCQYRMVAAVAGEAARAISVVNGVTQHDHWGESVVRAYNGGGTIKRAAGQTITVELSIQEVGPGVGTAEMSKARISVDKVG